ncbi:MAG: DoxX family protein [Propionibacteriaceae bacterium]
MTDRLHDLGLLALRLTVGGAGIAHGTQKLFGWFGGGGIAGTTRAMSSMGFEPPERSARMAGLAEAGGGVLVALGLATGAGGSALAGAMTTAGSVQKDSGGGYFATNGGYELPLVYGAAAGALALGGPGRYSADHLTGDALNKPWLRVVSLGAALASALYLIKQKRDLVDAQLREKAKHN